MTNKEKKKITYVTSSNFKKEENKVFLSECKLATGETIGEVLDFEIRSIPIKEILEVDLATMVQAEVISAYSQLKVPCIVEHAGLVFERYAKKGYPGGLTKPMWDTLGENFLEETHSANQPAIARAVVAYCDGLGVKIFTGETKGLLAAKPRGKRQFYWDTVFIPENQEGDTTHSGLTYAEIVEHEKLGLEFKIGKLSQSSKAMTKFAEYYLSSNSSLWD